MCLAVVRAGVVPLVGAGPAYCLSIKFAEEER